MGYSGEEGLYVLAKAQKNAIDAAGLHLGYYGNLY